MIMKKIMIEVPKGYVVDEDKSSFTNIVFKREEDDNSLQRMLCSERSYQKHYGNMYEVERILDLRDLQVKHYQNGDAIPLAVSDEQFKMFNKKSIGCYSVNSKGEFLYNWYAVNDERGLAPKGYKIPSIKDWELLEPQLKKSLSYNGFRNPHGEFFNAEIAGGFWWSTSRIDKYNVYCSYNVYNSNFLNNVSLNRLFSYALSVRCFQERTVRR